MSIKKFAQKCIDISESSSLDRYYVVPCDPYNPGWDFQTNSGLCGLWINQDSYWLQANAGQVIKGWKCFISEFKGSTGLDPAALLSMTLKGP